MSMRLYPCTECDALTAVKEWPATRYEPSDSTWGDGCCECGSELLNEPVDDLEPDVEPPEPWPDDEPPQGWGEDV